MFSFIIKGIFRDRHRWLFPLSVIIVSVAILVFAFSFMDGFMMSFVRQTARFDTGHVKVVSRAYSEMLNQKPHDLALLDIKDLLEDWRVEYPQVTFVERINFGALIDVPDDEGKTLMQADAIVFAIDLDPAGDDYHRMQIDRALAQGRAPRHSEEILISDIAFENLNLKLDDEITLLSSTVFGSMTMQNFRISGVVKFGIQTLDKGALIMDLDAARLMLDMAGGAGEILGFFTDNRFDTTRATSLARNFNQRYTDVDDEFSPVMLSMAEQGNTGYMLQVMDYGTLWMSMAFVIILGIVLWNSGLMNGIRRYGEFGLRLAIGESKRQVYFRLLSEALIIGFIGSLIGVSIGALISKNFVMDMSVYQKSSSILTENLLSTTMSMKVVWVGFFTGLLSSVLGASLAGIAVFNRQTSQLFKELET
jgi:putative ABC transport system permease protein